MAKNIFTLNHAERYKCEISKFDSGEASLWLRLQSGSYPDREEIRIEFKGVQYFSGPVRWNGASFERGTVAARQDLIARLGIFQSNYRRDLSEDDTENQLHLYEAETGARASPLFAVLAHSVKRHDFADLP